MSVSVFPAPAGAPSAIAKTLTATTANTVLYQTDESFEPYIYRIQCASSSIANVQFLDSSGNEIVLASTTDGTVDVNLTSGASAIRYWGSSNNLTINISIIGNSFGGSSVSGTLDTITATTASYNYSTSTKAYVVVVGGGGAGFGAVSGVGGGSGGLNGQLVNLSGTISVTIGAGAAANSNSSGGTTTFGSTPSVVATGGAAGSAGGAGGTPNGKAGNSGQPATSPLSFVINGSTGPGSGYQSGFGQIGSGIGTGGGPGASWNNATGYGAGGGSWDNASYGGKGTDGVVYCFRF